MQRAATNIQELNKQNPAPFSDDIIHNYDTYLRSNGIYLKERTEQFLAPIPLDRIVGIDQMYGDDATWGQCLEGRWLKRLTSNLSELSNNPDYFLTDTEMSGLSFKKIGDDYFIRTGKHRAIIARFFAHFNPEFFDGRSPFQHAHVTEYFVDREFTELQSRFEQVANQYPALSFEVNHTNVDSDTHFLMVREKGSSRNFGAFSRSQANEVLLALEKPSVTAKFKSGSDAYGHDNIYSFIPYSTCFKNLFK